MPNLFLFLFTVHYFFLCFLPVGVVSAHTFILTLFFEVDEKILGTDIKEKIDEELIEVMNGCICCTVRGDLVTTLKRLYSKVAKFDGIIIETTGLADPAPVAQTFLIDEEIQKMYSLDAIVTVVDAKHLEMRLDDEKPEGVENEAEEQLAFADIVLL